MAVSLTKVGQGGGGWVWWRADMAEGWMMRGFVRFLVVLVLVVVVAYLGAWWYVQGRMAVAFRAQEQQLRKAGWTVSHGATSRGSSPAAATFSVADLTLTPPDQGMPTPAITLPRFVLKVRPGSPFTLDVGLPLAWHVAVAQGPAFTIRFATIRDYYRFDPNALFDHAPDPVRSGALAFTGMRIDSADTNFTLVSVASFDAHGTRNPGADKAATFATVHEALSGLALSPIFVTLGHLPFEGKVASFSLDADLSGPPIATTGLVPQAGPMPVGPAAGAALWQKLGPAVHDWAQAGGHGTFRLAVALGPLKARDAGHFGFDQSVQPMGKATVVADGVGAFLGDIGSAYPATVGMISALSARTTPYMAKAANGHQRLTVNFALAGGVLTANGQKAADVPAVVWPPAAH